MIVVDSSALIAVLEKEPDAPIFAAAIHAAFSKPFDALTSDVERLAAADPKGDVEHPSFRVAALPM